MGLKKSHPIKDWKENTAITRMLKSNLFKDAEVISVHLKLVRGSLTRNKKYAEVVYKLGGKLYRTEFKLRDDRHWDKRRKDVNDKQGAKDSYFTASDLLGEEGVPEAL